MEEIIDNYKEHELHRKGENGKVVPYFRNEKTCSTCFTKRKEILDRMKQTRGGEGRDYINIIGHPDYKR